MLILGSLLWRTTGVGAPPPPPPAPVAADTPKGRAEWLGFGTQPRPPEPPTREQRTLHISQERERFGIIDRAARVIARVAARQAEALEADAHKQFEELERELSIEDIIIGREHVELLTRQRERLIGTEIGARLREVQLIEEETMVLLMIAAAL